MDWPSIAIGYFGYLLVVAIGFRRFSRARPWAIAGLLGSLARPCSRLGHAARGRYLPAAGREHHHRDRAGAVSLRRGFGARRPRRDRRLGRSVVGSKSRTHLINGGEHRGRRGARLARVHSSKNAVSLVTEPPRSIRRNYSHR